MKTGNAQIDDSALVQMYKDGDPNAFGIIIERYTGRIGTYIFMIVKDSMLTEDILQDTFIKAMKSIDLNQYNEEDKLLSWLLRIAHNLCMDYERHNKRNLIPLSIFSAEDSDHNTDGFSIQIPDPEDNPEGRIIKMETHFDLQKLLDNLPEEQKEVVVLRIFHDLSFLEISNFTNVSINTALGRMRYALINLRKQIEQVKNNGKSVLQNMNN